MSLIDEGAPSFRREVPVTTRLRKFGLVVGGAFAVITLVRLWRHGGWMPLACIAAVLVATAIAAPRLLAPIEWVWMRLAGLLGRVSTVLILTLTYFLMIIPIGLLLKLFRRDVLLLRKSSEPTYWSPVDPAGPSSRSREPY